MSAIHEREDAKAREDGKRIARESIAEVRAEIWAEKPKTFLFPRTPERESALPWYSLCRLFEHRWTASAWNSYEIEVEQKCKRCGAYRWHQLEDRRGFEEPKWRIGQHPVATNIRQSNPQRSA